jgi:hypothetical protein
MKFIRAKHPAVCWCLLPWFVEGNQTRKEIFTELYGRMEDKPDDTFVLVAMENGLCHGFMAAYCRDDDVFLWQSRTRDPFDKLYPDKTKVMQYNEDAFNLLFEWAKSRGKKSASALCTEEKVKDLVVRRYGFVKNGNLITKEIA